MKLLRLLEKCRKRRSAKIKIMNVDGVCVKYDAPMSVKEALVHLPNHAIFHSETVRNLGTRANPLPGRTLMEAGELYFVVPLPSGKVGTENFVKASKQGSKSVRHVSFAETPIYIEPTPEAPQASVSISSDQKEASRKPSLEVLSTSPDGPVRLKVIVSKGHLEALMNEGGDAVSIVRGLVDPLLKEAGTTSSVDSWKAALESISEASGHGS